MKHIIQRNDKGRETLEYIDLEEVDMDGEAIDITSLADNNYCDIMIGQCLELTWDQLDTLKKGIELAEKLWR